MQQSDAALAMGYSMAVLTAPALRGFGGTWFDEHPLIIATDPARGPDLGATVVTRHHGDGSIEILDIAYGHEPVLLGGRTCGKSETMRQYIAGRCDDFELMKLRRPVAAPAPTNRHARRAARHRQA